MKLTLKGRRITGIPVLELYSEHAHEKRPLVIMMHGLAARKENVLASAYCVATQGYYTILFDAHDHGELETAPLIEECPVNLECKVIHLLDLGSHTLVIGEIKETFIAEGCLTDGKPDAQKIDPLAFITGTSMYYRLGEQIAPAFQVGKE